MNILLQCINICDNDQGNRLSSGRTGQDGRQNRRAGKADIHCFDLFDFVELQRYKTGPEGFRPILLQVGLLKSQKKARSWIFLIMKKRNCTISIFVVKTKPLICCTVTAKLICIFVFGLAILRFSQDMALISMVNR